jgi:hypothetical protein
MAGAIPGSRACFIQRCCSFLIIRELRSLEGFQRAPTLT